MTVGGAGGVGRGKDGAQASLVQIRDLAGRLRGTGFPVDRDGTVLTTHEAVDSLARLALHAPGERVCLVDAEAVTPIPETGLALVAGERLGVPPLPIACGGPADPDGRAVLPTTTPAEVRVTGTTTATYTATDRFHLLDEVYELAAADGVFAPDPQLSGTPLLDARTGAVLGVAATAVHAESCAAGYAIPLRGGGALTAALARNGATVPAYGPHLNLAGVLRLTAPAGPRGKAVPRPDVEAEVVRFLAESGDRGPLVLGLVGDPGCGRTTTLAAIAARRAHDPHPAPTLRLRGAELRPGDAGLGEAVQRALREAGRFLAVSGGCGQAAELTADTVAGLARTAGRPLLVLLDAPEEMPSQPGHSLSAWTARTSNWLRAAGVRLVVACRPEYWEQAAALFPRDLLHRPAPGEPARPLPPGVRLGDLTPLQAAEVRERLGIPDDAVRPADAAHPLALRLLADVRAAAPEATGAPARHEIFAAHLDLKCLRVAERLAGQGSMSGSAQASPSGAAWSGPVRRLAARVAGRVHEAARHCLGPGQGRLDREAFQRFFPWRGGWSSAVLAEGLIVPAGAGYRFAHEEFADWLLGSHLDLDAALHALVHRWTEPPAARHEAAVRLPSRPATTVRPASREGQAPPPPPAPCVAPAEPPHVVPVPRHRIGTVVQALLLSGRREGAAVLAARLHALVAALDAAAAARSEVDEADDASVRRADAQWWAARLLGEALLRVPDAEPYLGVLQRLADRVSGCATRHGGFTPGPGLGEFGPWFWRRLPLGTADRLGLIRLLLPADAPPPVRAGGGADRFLDVAAEALRTDSRAAQAALCRWFADGRPVRTRPGTPARAAATVATAAQALLHTHRRPALDDLVATLAEATHPRAGELLAAIAEDEPSALCRAVDRWARDTRPERRAAAARYALAVAPHVRVPADRALLGRAALALAGGAADDAAHGVGLALLVADPQTRDEHLPAAIAGFTEGGRHVTARALAAALDTHPEPVLTAFRARLRDAGPGAREVLAALAPAAGPETGGKIAALVLGYASQCPQGAAHVAEYVRLRLEQGPGSRAHLLPLTGALLRAQGAGGTRLRHALATMLARPGSAASRPLRRELREMLRTAERDAAARARAARAPAAG